ncbi:protein TolR [Immundisolibacter sp.]|uniref:protein TolR n=1 Tax=Immundisolibacter sp. TaxID=1934948 RepID=UPI00198525FE|nr:protein TolR [Immundisolibacter sp.]MBC7161118.1 protein TolR [Immundisolibacter sp.]MEA3220846.1 Tol-Pal system protein TolR [Immundisolibacter sp.]
MAQTQGRRRRGRVVAEINVVPYIDVMLVLLIIFMITTPLLEQGVKVDLPQAEQGEQVEQEKQTPIQVTVDKDGRYYFDFETYRSEEGKPETAERLIALTQVALEKAPDAPVVVRGDKAVPYQAVIDAMALLQQAGARKVGLITQVAD